MSKPVWISLRDALWSAFQGDAPAGFAELDTEDNYRPQPGSLLHSLTSDKVRAKRKEFDKACTAQNYCQGNNLMDGCTGDVLQACQWGCSSGRCNGVPAPVATLKAVPSLVNKGDSTEVSWTSSNVTACTVTSTKDSWTGLNGTETSHPITSQTTFTLHCNGYAGASPNAISKSIIVNVAPSWTEQ